MGSQGGMGEVGLAGKRDWNKEHDGVSDQDWMRSPGRCTGTG